jgi:uncharacterized protein YbaP (TraB family)
MNRLNTVRLFVVASLLVVLSTSARLLPNPSPAQPESAMLFFKAVRDDLTLYLFGSISGSFQSQAGYPLPPRILTALRESQLYLHTTSTPESDDLFSSASLSPAAWEDLIKDEDAQQLRQIVSALGLDPEEEATLLTYHPWLILNLIYYSITAERGYRSPPEDEVLLEYAKEHGVEDLNAQIYPDETLFIQDISKEHAQSLFDWMRNRLAYMQFNLAQTLQNAWLNGEVASALDQLVLSRSPGYEAIGANELDLYEKINARLWQKLTHHLEQEQSAEQIFLSLSVDYLLDSGGFISFLEQNNFTISKA